jgi:hypothetical protein
LTSSWAREAPIPPLAPVTTATRPANLSILAVLPADKFVVCIWKAHHRPIFKLSYISIGVLEIQAFIMTNTSVYRKPALRKKKGNSGSCRKKKQGNKLCFW